MITVYDHGGYYADGNIVDLAQGAAKGFTPKSGREKTMA